MPRGRALCYTRAENSHHHPDLLPNLSTFMRHYSQSGAKGAASGAQRQPGDGVK